MVYTFNQFLINEGFVSGLDEFPKINFFTPKSFLLEREYGRGVSVSKKLYNMYITSAAKPKMDSNFPLINTSRAKEEHIQYIENSYPDYSNIYNKPEYSKNTNKIEFAKLFNDQKWSIFTAFDKQNAIKIFNEKGAVIGKPSEGHSGIGIEFIKDLEKLKQSNFELYQEPIEIAKEFRGLMIKDKLVYIIERVSVKKGLEQLKEKDPEDNMKFVYVDAELASLLDNYGNEILNISKKIYKKTKLDVYAVDFAIDKQGNYKVIELNLNSGPVTPFFIMRAVWTWWLANGESWKCYDTNNALSYESFWQYCNEQIKFASKYYYDLLKPSEQKLCLYPLYKYYENGMDIRDLISQYMCYYE